MCYNNYVIYMKKKLKDFFGDFLNKKFLISIIALMLVQAMLYWGVKLLQVDYHFINAEIDNKIPFIPHFVYVYNMFYPAVLLTMYYVYCKDRKNYYKGVIAGILGYLVCDIIFIAYPTIMNRPIVDYSKLDWFTGLVLKITYTADTPALNCCPSIHCLFCYQAMFSLCISKKIKWTVKIPVALFLFLIVLTTMFVKQHYFYDAVLALIIFIIMNIIVYSLKIYPKYTNKLKKKYKEGKDKIDNKKKNNKIEKKKVNKKINTN